jgi:ABC-type uncharacterized transport system YnjBCD permease subunit
MFGGNFAGMYFNFFIGALAYAITVILLNWHRNGWAHVQHELSHYLLALPLALVVSTILLFACHVLGVIIAPKR